MLGFSPLFLHLLFLLPTLLLSTRKFPVKLVFPLRKWILFYREFVVPFRSRWGTYDFAGCPTKVPLPNVDHHRNASRWIKRYSQCTWLPMPVDRHRKRLLEMIQHQQTNENWVSWAGKTARLSKMQLKIPLKFVRTWESLKCDCSNAWLSPQWMSDIQTFYLVIKLLKNIISCLIYGAAKG
jgi:hypothetical protein